MNENTNRTTLVAGIFVFVGLVLLGGLIFEFGTLRHRLRKPYVLYANFLDAQNLIKGAPVKRAGATIGEVVTSPQLVEGLKGVQVTLEIYPEFKIPVGSPLRIASVGLMGDSQLDVGQPPPELLKGEYLEPGSTLNGEGGADLASSANKITDEVVVVMRDLRNRLSDLGRTVGKVNDGVMSDENLANFSGGLKLVRESAEKVDEEVLSAENVGMIKVALADFSAAMKKIDGAAARAEGVMSKADSAMAKVDQAVDRLGPTLQGAERAAVSLKRAAVALEKLLGDARSGDGVLHALLHDEALRRDFTLLIANLKQRGILFYKDKEPKEGKDQKAAPEGPAGRARGKPYGAR